LTDSKNEKINIGCLKIFKLLYLLYQDKAYYKDVVEIFKDEIEEKSPNNIQVILNKNMNALKVFGLKIQKENNKYKLCNSIYSMKLTDEDIKSISILENSIKEFPTKEIKDSASAFIKDIVLRMDSENKIKLSNLNNKYDFSFYYKDLKEQINRAEELVKKNAHVDIVYLKNNKNYECGGEIKEVLYDSKNVSIIVTDIIKNERYIIPLSNIIQMLESPSLATGKEPTTTVVYKLKNRLAKTYKIKDNEYSQGFNENGEQTIVCKNEPFDRLLNRLMRYSYNCEIISPKFLREQMKELINEALKRYDK